MLRADIQSDAGAELARRYGVSSVPSFIVFDRSGEVSREFKRLRHAPIPELRRALIEASRRQD